MQNQQNGVFFCMKILEDLFCSSCFSYHAIEVI